ncbi:hypothetical protein [Polynucleobacter sp. JS-JIR-II-b4]|uniref:ATP-binding protein n=1 Tax=Polynucleobacter sp. JS-JIR-II-b4 TaxID=1758390 RepID=UPI001BFEEA02|nr:hypothetical protein [Polynucleobacter sp. JS-JIR-II-b4]QWE02880.1 hypothetical protein ICV90_01955 [Polynucleobacter sp. JS-JIR-II-b4]
MMVNKFSADYISRITPHLKEYFSTNFLEEIEKSPITNELDLLNCFMRLGIEVQRKYGIPASDQGMILRKITTKSGPNKFFVSFPYCNLVALEKTLKWLLMFFNKAANICFSNKDGQSINEAYLDLALNLKRLVSTGQNHPYIIEAAVQLRLPILKDLHDWTRIGIGAKGTDFFSSITMHTSSIGVRLVKNKIRAGQCLREMGFPCPEHVIVKDELAACEMANKMGYPVVIKPVDQDAGLGVSADISSDDMVKIAFQHASKHSNSIMVEKHFNGLGHRLLVLRGNVIKVTQKLPWGVVGDGKSSIEQLVKFDFDERYGKEALKGKVTSTDSFPTLDEEALSLLTQYGLSPNSILESQRFFALKRKNNASSGGSVEVIPVANVHPDNIHLCVRVALLFGLDICGVDLILPDIKRSWLEGGAVICDVNAQPQTDPQTIVSILESIIEDNGRVPMHLLLYEEAALPDSELDACLKKISNELSCNGVSSRQAVYINGSKVAINLRSSFHAARILMLDRQLLSGLCAIPFGELVKFGLPIDRFETIRILKAGTDNLLGDANNSGDRNAYTLSQVISMIKPHTSSLMMLG